MAQEKAHLIITIESDEAGKMGLDLKAEGMTVGMMHAVIVNLLPKCLNKLADELAEGFEDRKKDIMQDVHDALDGQIKSQVVVNVANLPEIKEVLDLFVDMANQFVDKHADNPKLTQTFRKMEKLIAMIQKIQPKDPTEEQKEAGIGLMDASQEGGVDWPLPEGYDPSKVTGGIFTGKGVDHELAHKLAVDAGKRMAWEDTALPEQEAK